MPQGGEKTGLGAGRGSLAWRGGLFVLLAGVAARWVIPWLLNAVTRTRNRELFPLPVIGCCVGLAFTGGLLGRGLALGLFVGGSPVSDSIFNHRVPPAGLSCPDCLLSALLCL